MTRDNIVATHKSAPFVAKFLALIMATVTSRLIELFRSLKSDAVPNPPRQANQDAASTESEPLPQSQPTASPQSDTNSSKKKDECDDDDDLEEVVFTEDDFVKEEKKKHFDIPFKPKKNKGDGPKEPKDPKTKTKKDKGSYTSVNTQATGSVFNIMNSSGIQFGSNYTYYMSSGKKVQKDVDEQDDHIEKDSLIMTLMDSSEEPSPKYLNFVSKSMGLNWIPFFINLGYLKGQIETLSAEKGIIEARFHLLDDWVHNAYDATLGRLANLLWEADERQIVQRLSQMYKESKKYK